jgi:type II secretory pathway component GspD/PulD (secretin)
MPMLSPRAACCGLILILAGLAQTAPAQTESTEARPAEAYRTFYLTSLTEPYEANEIVADLRSMLPAAHLYYVSSEGAISMRGKPDEIALAERVLADMDRKRQVYRITYSIRESEEGKPAGARRIALIVSTGGKTTVKEGSRFPIASGAADAKTAGESTQIQYIDLGLNIEASLEGSGDGLRLHSRVEQSGVSEEKSSMGSEDPIIRQTRLEGFSTLSEGRPMVLGSLDLPGTARHQEIEVVSELVK